MLRKISTALVTLGVTLAAVFTVAPAEAATPDRVYQNAAQFTRGDARVFKATIVTAWGKSARLYLGARGHQLKTVRDHTVTFMVGRHTLRDNAPTTVTLKVYRDKRTLYVKRYRIEDVVETRGEAILREARQEKGDRYAYGGSGPSRWDCSGLVAHAVREATGRRLPHSSAGIARAGTRVHLPRPGDVVYTPGHVSIYAGHGRVVEAARPGTRVREVPRWQHAPRYYRF